MRILIYKRTHNGDPDARGCFGVYDCMGTVRDRDFDAVIGVGGRGAEAQANDIAAKINWIGIGPHKSSKRGKHSSAWRGLLVTFDHFRDFGTDGLELRDVARVLARRLYSKKARLLLLREGSANGTRPCRFWSLPGMLRRRRDVMQSALASG